jgi:hypothetical protein
MKRHLMTLAFAALAGSFLLTSSAQACHKRKTACAAPAPVCAPAPVVCAAPAPVCAPARAKHGHGFKNPMKGMKLGHGHKKAAPVCAPAPCEQVVYSAPAQYAAPIYAAPQASGQYASPQASGQL